jgi:hypothetical protein
VFHEVVAGLPSWLFTGVLLGLLGTGLVAVAFLAAESLFPGGPHEQARTQSGESRRRAEFRAYLDDIGEQFAEDHPVQGQQVAFYLPRRDVAITFDPQAYYRIDRSETTPILVEHEMPGSALGNRLPFEVPEREVAAPAVPNRSPAQAAFAELGVSAGASAEEIQEAYRERVKEVHPDQGGDEDEFKRVREAYTLAKQHAS